MEATITSGVPRVPWNKNKLTGQKPPRKLPCTCCKDMPPSSRTQRGL
jgi:hypothetical protein